MRVIPIVYIIKGLIHRQCQERRTINLDAHRHLA